MERPSVRPYKAGALLGVMVVAGGAVAWLFWPGGDDPLPPQQMSFVDPRLSLDTPYRNVKPDVAYVGDQACRQCHEEVFESYRQTPMGNSLVDVAKATAIEKFDSAHGNPFETEDRLRYAVERRGDRVFHVQFQLDHEGQAVSRDEVEIKYAIGSGNHARSYLFQRDDFNFYSPITWYSQKQVWRLSPAMVAKNDRFWAGAEANCLFCHSNQIDKTEPVDNQFRIVGHSIGCERCHGPGKLHVQRHEDGEEFTGLDDTIVNPAHLPLVERDSVCEQCHLGSQRVSHRGLDWFDFRPGLPLHEFVSCFTKPTQKGNSFTGHCDQMRESRCYQGTDGKMGCISCHDPHSRPPKERRVEFFRNRCLNCHGDDAPGCGMPREQRLLKSPQDNCAMCHMPTNESTNILHVAATNHRIPRIPGASQSPVKDSAEGGKEEELMGDFYAHLVDADDFNAKRDFAIVLVQYYAASQSNHRQRALDTAISILEATVKQDPGDVRARNMLGGALWEIERWAPAVAAIDEALSLNPRDEFSLMRASRMAMAMGQHEKAIALWKRLMAVNPKIQFSFLGLADAYLRNGQPRDAIGVYEQLLKMDAAEWQGHQGLGDAYAATGQFEKALVHFRHVLKIHPQHSPVRQQVIRCYMGLGQDERAKAEYELLQKISAQGRQPENR